MGPDAINFIQTSISWFVGNDCSMSAFPNPRPVFSNPRPQSKAWMARKALDESASARAKKLALMSSNKNFLLINFIWSTFFFVQRFECTHPAWEFKNSTVPHGIYTFEVVWSVTKVESCYLNCSYRCQTKQAFAYTDNPIYFSRSKRWNPVTVRFMLISTCSLISQRSQTRPASESCTGWNFVCCRPALTDF